MAFAQLTASHSVFAQHGGAATRAAVVIGVNKTGNLPILRAAASSAHSVNDWLQREGFEVKVIVDDHREVAGADIKQAVKEFVERGTIEQLVVYFSGHGVGVAFNEYWLLTGAPDDADEAVSVAECIALARATAIPNVTIISDACRSVPNFNASRIRGTLIFPNWEIRAGAAQPEVDRFFATLPGAKAYEVGIASDNHKGIYTETFLDAFREPNMTMVRTVRGDQVVPNRNLKGYLLQEVPKRLAKADITLNQVPDSRIESGIDTYIGRAISPHFSFGLVAPDTPATIMDLADSKFRVTKVGQLASSLHFRTDEELKRVAAVTGFDALQSSILSAKQPESFEGTGFVVNGAPIEFVSAAGGARAEILDPGDGEARPGLVRISSANQVAASAILGFRDGSGTVLAAMPEFVGTVVVKNGLVTNVSYVPSASSFRRSDYVGNHQRLDELRALVATAAKFGVFRIEGDADSRASRAERLANQIRILKGVDPTLGLYAAYAYSDANLTDKVRSVHEYMRGDLNADLFDVALLAGQLSHKNLEGPEGPIPFTPLLTQGWQLLRVKNVRLLPELHSVQAYLRPALWTTFDKDGMNFIRKSVDLRKLR